eukprot:TRINITY_DN5999_c0_g1_i1.p1 TRINITY_DN5999_c0_g1~~TRINITY_DN5999_c0_g1_i1.p1  ORF type:complete len:491 (+),score=71.28 TRINITY_DN5999_c0_g1_i1:1156-2628(+)
MSEQQEVNGQSDIPAAPLRTLYLNREGGSTYGLVFSSALLLQKVNDGSIASANGAQDLLGFKLVSVNGKPVQTRNEVANILCKEKSISMELEEHIVEESPEMVFDIEEEEEEAEEEAADEKESTDSGNDVKRRKREPTPDNESEAELNEDDLSAAPQPDSEITVMTYNILSDWCCRVYREELYAHITDDQTHLLSWEYRSQLLRRDIQEHKTDVICLQEVDAGVVCTDLSDFLSELGYEYDFIPKTKEFDVDGVLLAWNPLVLKKLYTRKLRMQTMVRRELAKPQVALLNEFQLLGVTTRRGTPKRLLVITSHIFFAPPRGDVKHAQCQVLLDCARDYMCGRDLDTHGHATDITAIQCGPLKSAYREFYGREPFWTTSHANQRGTVDYVFTAGCACTGVMSPVVEHNRDKSCLLPSTDQGSDHIPVVVRLKVISPRAIAICGDFNFTPDSTLYKFVSSGGSRGDLSGPKASWSGNMSEKPAAWKDTTLYD